MKYSGWQLFEVTNQAIYFTGSCFKHYYACTEKDLFNYKRRRVLQDKWNYCLGKNKKGSRFLVILEHNQISELLKLYREEFPGKSFKVRRVWFDMFDRDFNIQKVSLFNISFRVVVSKSCKLIPVRKMKKEKSLKRQLLFKFA